MNVYNIKLLRIMKVIQSRSRRIKTDYLEDYQEQSKSKGHKSLKKNKVSQSLAINYFHLRPQRRDLFQIRPRPSQNKNQIKSTTLTKNASRLGQKVSLNPEISHHLNNQKYQIFNSIGKGTFGEVYLAKDILKNKQIAIKKIYQDKKFKNRELQIMKMLNHKNLIKIKDHYTRYEDQREYLYIVMNYYSCDFYSLIKHKQIQPDLLKIYLYQILKGLEYLALKKIAHRDLKPHNILIKKDTHRVVICDFGSAKKIQNSDTNISYICARCYRAPELIFGATNYSTQVDMWSFGCIAIEAINGLPLFQANSNYQQMIEIIKIMGTPSVEDVKYMNPQANVKQFQDMPIITKTNLQKVLYTNDEILIDLLQKIMVYNPRKRFTPNQALNHRYFNSIKNGRQIKILKRKYGRIFNISESQEQTNHKFINSSKTIIKNEFPSIQNITQTTSLINSQLYETHSKFGNLDSLIINKFKNMRQKQFI